MEKIVSGSRCLNVSFRRSELSIDLRVRKVSFLTVKDYLLFEYSVIAFDQTERTQTSLQSFLNKPVWKY